MIRLGIALVLLLLMVLVIGAIGCGEDRTSTVAPTPATRTPTPIPTPMVGYLTYTDVFDGFSIAYPEDWSPGQRQEVDTLQGQMSWVMFGSTVDDEFHESFSVTCENLPYHISVEDCFRTNTDPPPDLDGFTPISEERLSIGSLAAIKYVCTWVNKGETLQVMQIYLAKGTRWWMLTFTTIPAAWKQYEPIFDTIAGTFQLLE